MKKENNLTSILHRSSMLLTVTKLGSQGWAVDSPATVLTPPSSVKPWQQWHPGVSSSPTVQTVHCLCGGSACPWRPTKGPAQQSLSKALIIKRNIVSPSPAHHSPQLCLLYLLFAYNHCTCCFLVITELTHKPGYTCKSDNTACSRCSSQAAASGEKHHHLCITALLKPSHTTAQLLLQTSKSPRVVPKEVSREIYTYIPLIALLILSFWPQHSSLGRPASPAACLGMAGVTAGTWRPLPHCCLQAVASPTIQPAEDKTRVSRTDNKALGPLLPSLSTGNGAPPHMSPLDSQPEARASQQHQGAHQRGHTEGRWVCSRNRGDMRGSRLISPTEAAWGHILKPQSCSCSYQQLWKMARPHLELYPIHFSWPKEVREMAISTWNEQHQLTWEIST